MSDYSQVRSFNLGVAQETSIEGALIYDDLIYAQKNFGTEWFYRSYEQMLNRFPMLSEQTIRRHIKKLVDAGWVSTKVMKVNGTPVCHYQIGRFLSTKMADSKETTKMADSINNNTKTTQKVSDSKNNDFLLQLISLVNPREKPTADRTRALNARLKDYTAEEITQAAIAFSKSEWHRNNKQMSIDNLLAPSKFGRWYAQRKDVPATAAPTNMVIDPAIEGSKFFPAAWPKGEPEYSEDDDERTYFRGVLIDASNQNEMLRISKERRSRNNASE